MRYTYPPIISDMRTGPDDIGLVLIFGQLESWVFQIVCNLLQLRINPDGKKKKENDMLDAFSHFN